MGGILTKSEIIDIDRVVCDDRTLLKKRMQGHGVAG